MSFKNEEEIYVQEKIQMTSFHLSFPFMQIKPTHTNQITLKCTLIVSGYPQDARAL